MLRARCAFLIKLNPTDCATLLFTATTVCERIESKCVLLLLLGTCVHGYDESTDDHPSADATDLVPPSAAGPAAATASFNATAGKTHTFTDTLVVECWRAWMCLLY